MFKEIKSVWKILDQSKKKPIKTELKIKIVEKTYQILGINKSSTKTTTNLLKKKLFHCQKYNKYPVLFGVIEF